MPTRYRERIEQDAGGAMTVTRHHKLNCLLIFTRPQWNEFSERLMTLPMSAEKYRRTYLGDSNEVELDGTGRILITPEQREMVGLHKEVVLKGVGKYFELWDKGALLAQEALDRNSGNDDSAFETLVF